jgi:cobaltochelatase CobN
VEHDRQSTILLLSTSDTDLLAAKASGADYRLANPVRLDPAGLGPLLDGAAVVVVRLLGGEQAWREGLAALRGQQRPLIVLGGEMMPDAALMALSSVPAGIAAQAHEYLAHGGPANLRELAHFLADTVLLAGHGFGAPEPMPAWGLRPWPADSHPQPADGHEPAAGERAPVVAVLYYRAHELAGNIAFVDALCTAIGSCGARAMPVWCASLRAADPACWRPWAGRTSWS